MCVLSILPQVMSLCCICLSELPKNGVNRVRVCAQCGICMQRACWAQYREPNKPPLSCPHCRGQIGILTKYVMCFSGHVFFEQILTPSKCLLLIFWRRTARPEATIRWTSSLAARTKATSPWHIRVCCTSCARP